MVQWWSYDKQKDMKAVFLEHQKDYTTYRLIFKQFHRILKLNTLCVMHLGVVKNFDVATRLAPLAETEGFEIVSIIYEDASHLESHGIVDRGATQKHNFYF